NDKVDPPNSEKYFDSVKEVVEQQEQMVERERIVKDGSEGVDPPSQGVDPPISEKDVHTDLEQHKDMVEEESIV
ncbi:hypothetical protein A2U01_0104872, partial [Trifolium medium]|nr:hypothetical protein [Trifolium medium]